MKAERVRIIGDPAILTLLFLALSQQTVDIIDVKCGDIARLRQKNKRHFRRNVGLFSVQRPSRPQSIFACKGD